MCGRGSSIWIGSAEQRGQNRRSKNIFQDIQPSIRGSLELGHHFGDSSPDIEVEKLNSNIIPSNSARQDDSVTIPKCGCFCGIDQNIGKYINFRFRRRSIGSGHNYYVFECGFT